MLERERMRVAKVGAPPEYEHYAHVHRSTRDAFT